MTKDLIKNICAMAVCLLVLLSATPVLCQDKAPSDAKLALVNDVPVYKTELDREMRMLISRLTQQGNRPNPANLKNMENQMIENIIERELLIQKSKESKIAVSTSAVAKTLNDFKGRFPNDEEYKTALKELDMTEERLRSQIQNGMSIRKLLDAEVIGKIRVLDKEAKTHYDTNPAMFMQPEQVKASHILIKVAPDADEQTKNKALEAITAIYERIKNGENFSALAIDNSQCPSKAKGGDLGYFSKQQMVKPFSDAAFSLESGQVSQIVKTQFGFHVIKVTDKKASSQVKFEDAREQIKHQLRRIKQEQAIKKYVGELRKNSRIERFTP